MGKIVFAVLVAISGLAIGLWAHRKSPKKSESKPDGSGITSNTAATDANSVQKPEWNKMDHFSCLTSAINRVLNEGGHDYFFWTAQYDNHEFNVQIDNFLRNPIANNNFDELAVVMSNGSIDSINSVRNFNDIDKDALILNGKEVQNLKRQFVNLKKRNPELPIVTNWIKIHPWPKAGNTPASNNYLCWIGWDI